MPHGYFAATGPALSIFFFLGFFGVHMKCFLLDPDLVCLFKVAQNRFRSQFPPEFHISKLSNIVS